MNVLKRFDDILTSPWVLWGISLSVAIFMWFYVMDTGESGNERRKFLCQLEYRNLAPQYHVRNPIKEVEVEVEAPENIMNRLKFDSIMCEVDVKGLSAGKYRLSVKTTIPQNVLLVDVNPSEVDVELLRQAGRVFAVEVTLPQDIPEGQYLESVEVIPKEINVKGTERDLAKIGTVSVAPTFEELEAGKELLLPLKMTQSEPFESEVTFEPPQVKMNATLVRGLPRKKVAVNVRLSGKPFMDYAVQSVTTDPAEVMLEGAKSKLNAVSAVDTETVDISNLSSDQTMVVPLRSLKDKGISVVDVKAVKLLIKLEPIAAQRQFLNIPVTLEGTDKEKWTVNPASVNVTVEASPSLMERLNPDTLGLRVHVDVSNIFLRTVTLPVRAALASDDFRVVKIDPFTVTVNAVEGSLLGR